jgi:hypothetical protein
VSWELTFDAAKPGRPHRYFWCVTIMEEKEPDLWWCDAMNAFLPHGHPALKEHSHGNSSKPVRTIRAFKRFLNDHPELRGRRVRLVNRYVGFDVEAEFKS